MKFIFNVTVIRGISTKTVLKKRVIMELIVFLTTRSVCLVSVIVILFAGLEIETPFSFAHSFNAIYVKGTHAIKNKVKWKVSAKPSKIISPDAGILFLKRKRNKIGFEGDFYQLIKSRQKKPLKLSIARREILNPIRQFEKNK